MGKSCPFAGFDGQAFRPVRNTDGRGLKFPLRTGGPLFRSFESPDTVCSIGVDEYPRRSSCRGILTTLESYLTGDILRDRADISRIETVLRETASTIAATFVGTHWPYEVIRGIAPKRGPLSQSTTAMMIRAIDLILGAAGEDPNELSYVFELEKRLCERLQEIRNLSANALTTAINRRGKVQTTSKTYGRNDPLTLSFLAEIFRAKDDAGEDFKFPQIKSLRIRTT